VPHGAATVTIPETLTGGGCQQRQFAESDVGH
jgi:hypothetical protein